MWLIINLSLLRFDVCERVIRRVQTRGWMHHDFIFHGLLFFLQPWSSWLVKLFLSHNFILFYCSVSIIMLCVSHNLIFYLFSVCLYYMWAAHFSYSASTTTSSTAHYIANVCISYLIILYSYGRTNLSTMRVWLNGVWGLVVLEYLRIKKKKIVNITCILIIVYVSTI